MRAPLRTLLPALLLSLAACISGRRTILVEAPSRQPAPPPRPVTVMKPAPLPPAPLAREALEVTLGRPSRGQLPIQTSRAAYVAIFEIIPNQGVTLVQPTSTQRRRVTPAGVNAFGTWWSERRTPNDAQPARYIYVVAADQPLRLSDQAYQSDYWERALGVAAYRGSNLYATMRAISRVVVPAVTEQDWAEDMLAVAPAYARQTPQQLPTARVYCPDGSVREVPMDFADRAICPMRVGSNEPGRVTRADSAFANGRRIDARGPRDRNPVDRVGDGNDPHYGARNEPRNDPRGGRPTPRPSTPVTPAPAHPAPVTPAPARPPRRDEPATRPTPTPNDRNDAKREEKEERRDAREERKEAKQDAKEERQDAKQDAREERQDAKREEQAERKDAREEAKAERKDAKEEAKAEPKQEAKSEPKQEEKSEAKQEDKSEAKEAKDEAKDERKGEGQQPDSDQRRAPGRQSQGGKPNRKS